MTTKQPTFEYFNALGYPIEGALKFAIEIHEVDQQQKRKGKDIPYIVHPLIVGLILARVGASENVVAAGILHDTIEDSIPDKKVLQDMLAKKFGKDVADIVASVTEPKKDLPWVERKKEAIERIKTFSHDSLLVKSADVISNASEIIADYEKDGEKIFARFNAPKEKMLRHHLETITAIRDRWEGNPLVWTLRMLASDIQSRVAAGCFMMSHPTKIILCEALSSHKKTLVVLIRSPCFNSLRFRGIRSLSGTDDIFCFVGAEGFDLAFSTTLMLSAKTSQASISG